MADRTLAEAGPMLGLAPSTLRIQVERGKLRARKIGKTWVTNDRWIEEYRRDHLGRRRKGSAGT